MRKEDNGILDRKSVVTSITDAVTDTEEGAYLVYSDSSTKGVIVENLDVTVYGTQYGIGEGTGGKVMGSTHGAPDMSKLGGYSLGKALGAALVVSIR